MPTRGKFRQLGRKTKEFAFNWRTVVLVLASAAAFLSPFLAASGSEAASSEYLATLIAQEAVKNTESMVLNVNYAPIPSDTPVTRAEVSSMCTEAHLDSTYKYVEMEYNARVVVNENVGDYVRIGSFEHPETSLVLSNVFSNHLNPLGETIFDIFELKLMFPKSNTNFSGYDNFCYIRQEDADYLIKESNGLYQNYEDLIDEVLEVNFVGSEDLLRWKIANIVSFDNDVYRHFNTVLGSWALCYIYLPSFEGCAFNFDYGGSVRTNETYLDMYRDRFGGQNFTIAITTRDILDQEASRVDEIRVLMLGSAGEAYSTVASVALSLASLAPLLVSLIVFRKFVYKRALGTGVLFVFVAFFLYEGFSVAYLVSPLNVIYFTGQGLLLFLLQLLLSLGFVLAVRAMGGPES